MNERKMKQWFVDNDPGNAEYVKCLMGLEDAIIDEVCGWGMEHGDQAEDLCKSPIEKLLFVAFAARMDFRQLRDWRCGRNSYCAISPPDHDSPDLDTYTPPKVYARFDVVSVQHRIGEYTADMLIRRWVSDGPDGVVTASPGVVVECDGHDFHERTKEQASHDKQRDRMMQTRGYLILRFTGSEIFRDPSGCAKQIDECLDGHIARVLAQIKHQKVGIA